MKVLMVNTPSSQGLKGGDLTQMRKTARALEPMGVRVTESFDLHPDPAGFDLAHVFNMRTVQTTTQQVAALRKKGIPVVLSPIYLDTSRPLWATRVIKNIFETVRPEPELESLLRRFATYGLEVVNQKEKWSCTSVNRIRPDYDNLQRSILHQVDHILPNSVLEANALAKTLRVLPVPMTVVPYGVDPATFLEPDPAPFVKKYGVKDFILEVGRVEPSKNQVMLLRALRNEGLPVVLIGGTQHHQYLAWCRRNAPKDLLMIPHLPSDELRSAYAAARVHVLPSWVETCGLVTMEAALADCSVVVTATGYELEYFESLAHYCDPASTHSIREVVKTAYRDHEKNAGMRKRLKERILREFTWEVAARKTFEAYQSVLARRA